MNRRSRLLEANGAAAAFYRHELLRAATTWPAGYLAQRRLDHVLAWNANWAVGYAPDAWSRLTDHLRGQGFDDETLLNAGLAKVTQNGYMIDQFRDRLMFTAYDKGADPVGFVGRGRGGLVKYLNTPATSIYQKSRTLVGLAEQRNLLARGGIPVLVEGPTDAVAVGRLSMLTKCGWAGVATCGTSLSAEQASLLKESASSDIVIVAADADPAGRSAAIRWLGPLSETFREVLCATLPPGEDPSSLFASEHGADRLSRALSFPRPLIEVAIDAEISRWSRVLDHISGRVNALRAVTPLVTRMPGDRVAGEVVRLSRLLQLDEQTVSREVLSAVSTASRRTVLPRSPTGGTDRPPPRLEL
jgi:DNA primase catalytic core